MSTTRYSATENLIATLRRRERSGSWLARKIGVSPSLVHFVLRGERTMAADKAIRAAAVLDEPIDYLFVNTDAVNSSTEACEEAA
jgi:hypothetical protein